MLGHVQVMGRVELCDVQAVVPGQDDLEDLRHHVRLGEVQRLQELPGRGGVRDGAPYRGQAAGDRAGQVHHRAVLAVEGRDLAAVLEPDDRLGPGRAGLIPFEPGRPPQGGVGEQEGVEARDPLIGLRLEELAGHPRNHVRRRDLVDADLFAQVAPQDRREVLGDGLIREPDRPARAAQRAQLIRVEELVHLRAAGQLQVNGHAVTAAGDRDQRFGGQRLTHRIEQRAEHGASREARGVKRQRRSGLHREEAVVAQFPQHVGEQRGGLAYQRLVRRVMSGDVVAGGRGPVRALDQETEERLLLGGEEHGQRRIGHRDDPAGLEPERDLDPLRLMALDRTVPDQPLLAGGRPGTA